MCNNILLSLLLKSTSVIYQVSFIIKSTDLTVCLKLSHGDCDCKWYNKNHVEKILGGTQILSEVHGYYSNLIRNV